MKLYLIHCGFYDTEVFEGVYEFHVNYFVVAESFEDARARGKLEAPYKDKRMHIDGIQEIQAVNGYRIEVAPDPVLEGKTAVISQRLRELALAKKPV